MSNRVKLSTVTTYKFGGYCDNFIELKTKDDLKKIQSIDNLKNILLRIIKFTHDLVKIMNCIKINLMRR